MLMTAFIDLGKGKGVLEWAWHIWDGCVDRMVFAEDEPVHIGDPGTLWLEIVLDGSVEQVAGASAMLIVVLSKETVLIVSFL